MSEQVSSLCRSCLFQLCQIRTIRRSLTSDSTKTLVNAFVNSRLDYCNSLYGVGEGLMDRLQRVQNAAARLKSGAKKYNHITQIRMDLHWLPIRRRVTFKVATLVYKCLHALPSTSPMTASMFRRFLVVVFCVRRRIWNYLCRGQE